jgi:hypothetical protein
VNGGSGYTGGFTSGGTTFVGSTFCQTTATPNAVLPAFANSPYYRSGYGHGSNGLPLLVLVPAVSLFPHYVGVNANVLTL